MKRLFIACVMLLVLPCIPIAGALPDTGQTKCYDNTQEITCPLPGQAFYGQDANYAPCNPHSYTDLGNGIVRDNVTGLEWQQDTAPGIRTWQQALDYCDGLGLGGHADWRLPTIKELSTLVDSSIPLPGPTINTDYFSNTNTQNCYWSSTTYAYNPNFAWYVAFDDGSNGGVIKSYGIGYVRAVRGGQSGPFDDLFNLVDNGDGTITDLETGLMWEVKTDDGGERDKDNLYTWQQALSYCENLELADYNDWRLPNHNELQSIVDYSRYNPSIDPLFSYTMPYFYWSSTTYASTPGSAWFVSFYGGDVDGDYGKSRTLYVRVVRGGQCGGFDDSDGDGIPDYLDNCPNDSNHEQEDTYPPQGNGIGDACECEGNFDDDNDVDSFDAAVFKVDFGRSILRNPCTDAAPCNGDFTCETDVDSSDAALFKTDFGRSPMRNPCPLCVTEPWCVYP